MLIKAILLCKEGLVAFQMNKQFQMKDPIDSNRQIQILFQLKQN